MRPHIGWSAQELVYLCVVVCTFFCTRTDSSAVQLQSHNIDDILRSNELVFINFYADWCRFSQMLGPVFDDASNKVKAEFPEAGKVVLGKVDCDREGGIASQYHVSKYPTLKVFRYGTLVKREYRGQRSADALANFVRDAVKDPVKRITTIDELDNLDAFLEAINTKEKRPGNSKKLDEPSRDEFGRKKRHIIGYFDSETSPDFSVFRKIASMLRDDCEFVAALGTVSEKERATGNRIVYRPPDPDATDIPYSGDIQSFNVLHTWATDKCIPLVREITFENAEELTEEGLPFLILFHQPDDTDTPEKFRRVISRDLLQEKNGVNFLTADGNKFSHPLYHLGKSTSDLPVVAIDSFRHMYLWKLDPREHLENGDALKQFIADLHSGKLHREFHHGPDKTTPQPKIGDDGGTGSDGAVAKQDGGDAQVQQQIILSANGMTVQIVRVVEIGNPRQLNLHNQLQQLSKELIGGENKGETPGGDGEKPWEESDDKKPSEPGKEEARGGDEKAAASSDPAGSSTEKMEVAQDELPAEGEHKVIHEKVIKVTLMPDTNKAHEVTDEQPPKPVFRDVKAMPKDGVPLTDFPPKVRLPEDMLPRDRPDGQPLMIDLPMHGQRIPRQLPHAHPMRQADSRNTENQMNEIKQPPKSIFQHLRPSRSKYTILEHDEF